MPTTYKLFGLDETLLEMLPAEEWFDKFEELIGYTPGGHLGKWLAVNREIIQKILADRPELRSRLHQIVNAPVPE